MRLHAGKGKASEFGCGTGLAHQVITVNKKGGEIMKRLGSCLSVLVLVGSLGAGVAKAADGVLLKEDLDSTSYCHMKFPAIRQSTLGDKQPQLEDSATGAIVDFYGPCDESPVGQDQIASQRIEHEHQWEGSRMW
jgi:hypothetical protein